MTWEDALIEGRFQFAYQAYSVSDDFDAELRDALSTLADIEGFVRDKGWNRAVNKVKQLEDPPPIVDWEGVATDLQSLWDSSSALDRRESEEALELLRVRSTPFFEAEIATQRGTALIFDNDLEAAKGYFERALEYDPRHYRAITNLGNIALEQGRVDEAVAAYERALKLNDDFPNAYHNLGVAYRRQGKFSKSVGMLRRAQRATNRRDTEVARSRLSRGGLRMGRNVRWIVIGGAVVVAYLVLRSRGII
jgi:tetratricopeptide (TPR) repeat protein